MTDNSAVRQALLKSAFQHLYPGLAANEWQPASVMLKQINSTLRHRGSSPRSGTVAALDPKHFELRDTPSAGANRAARELRSVKRTRGRAD